jgi:hypothetical protein
MMTAITLWGMFKLATHNGLCQTCVARLGKREYQRKAE